MSKDNPRRLQTAGTSDETATKHQLRSDGGVETVPVCPECGSRQVRTRQPSHPNTPVDCGEYYCNGCATRLQDLDHVPEADAPPLQRGGIGQSDAGRLLLDADPDDFGGAV